MKHITLRLTENEYKRLREVATTQRLHMTVFIMRLVDDYFKQNPYTPQRRQVPHEFSEEEVLRRHLAKKAALAKQQAESEELDVDLEGIDFD